MRRITAYIILSLAAATFWACSNFETSGNGDFGGFWQLEQVDTLATGGITDMHNDLIFWAVQHRLIELQCRQTNAASDGLLHLSVFYHFERSGDTLRFLADPLPVLDLRPEDPYAELNRVTPYGLSRIDETFVILSLDSDHMTMQSELLRLHFRKY